MEIKSVDQAVKQPVQNKQRWTGRVISWLCSLFLLFDAVSKIARESHSVEGSVKLGWPNQSVQSLGIVLLICTIVYSIPRTATLGAILLTGYLGGAIAIMFRAGEAFAFPLIVGIFVWAGVWLKEYSVRKTIPLIMRDR